MTRRRRFIALLAASPALVFQFADAADDDAPPTRLVLRVAVEKIESTSFHPAPEHECPAGVQCVQMVFWSKYRARVIEVVAGDWPRAEIEFLRLEHAPYVEDILRDCYVVLRPSGAKLRERLPLDWVATRPRVGAPGRRRAGPGASRGPLTPPAAAPKEKPSRGGLLTSGQRDGSRRRCAVTG